MESSGLELWSNEKRVRVSNFLKILNSIIICESFHIIYISTYPLLGNFVIQENVLVN